MDVFETIQNRRSIRKYSDKAVEDEKLNKVLEAARLSPSAHNYQNKKIIVIKDEETKIKLAEATRSYDFIAQAPVVLISCGTGPDTLMSCGQSRHSVDLSIATSFMILEACELGLGTCWIGGFNSTVVKEVLGIPENATVVAITPLGYPAENPAARPRRAFDEVVCYEKYE